MKSVTLTACCLLLLAGVSTAQITSIPASSLISPQIDNFESYPAGPAPACFPSGGIFILNNPGLGVPGDTLTAGSNADGKALVSQGNTLAIADVNDPIDNLGAGFTFQFQLLSGLTATQFGFLMVDQAGQSFTVETWSGGVLQNSFPTTYGSSFPSPPVYFEDLAGFDEVRVVSGSNAGWGMDNVAFGNVTGTPPPSLYQANTSALTLHIDGVQGGACGPALVTKDIVNCAPLTPATGTLTISSTEVGAIYDVLVSAQPILPAFGGGIILSDGQVVNVDVFSPFTWLSTGTATGAVMTLPSYFPGATQSTIALGFSLSAATQLSMQGVVINPSAPLGFTLSQATELNVNLVPPPTSIAGPTNASTSVSVDVTSAPTCWVPGGIPFYGSTFTTMHVSPNGFVSFGGTDTDGSPSLSDAINDDGRVGFWTDLDPSEGGTVTISNPAAGIIRVDYAGVWYNTGGPGTTFGIQFDTATGVIQVDGLGGLVANPNTSSTLDDQFLGITPGITFAPTVTTDPGAAGFGLGLNGAAAVATDMLYEFNDVSVSLSGLPASVVGGMTTLVFTPDGMGNYNWAGM